MPECPETGCTFCNLMQLGENILDFLIGLAIPVSVGFIAWGGIILITAGGSERKVSEGRRIVTGAITGLVIVLCSWLILSTLLQIIAGQEWYKPWKKIECLSSQKLARVELKRL